MSDSSTRRPSLDQLRKQAKELLRQHRAGDSVALARFASANPRSSRETRAREVSLVDAHYVLAREAGYESWADLKHALDGYRPRYERLALDILAALGGEVEAVETLGKTFGGDVTPDRLRGLFTRRLDLPEGHQPTGEDARLFVARFYGFEDWSSFLAGLETPKVPRPAVHGLSASPPFFRFDAKENSLEPSPPLDLEDWEALFEIMRARGISTLRTGQMTDAAMAILARHEFVTELQLEGSRALTDAGLRHLAALPNLRNLNLTGCGITDAGLAILRDLPELRDFSIYHHRVVTDDGLIHLGACLNLERVAVMGCHGSGDRLLAALAGKPHLRLLKTGESVTDAGLAHLQGYPLFREWTGQEPEMALMGAEAGPTYLLPRGPITDAGLARLAGLDGLFALDLDDSRFDFSPEGVRRLAGLANLGWLGVDATDDLMAAVAELPRLRFLMAQDAPASDAGFVALARSRSLEYLWGRRCYGLAGDGFRAMSRMPSIRGLSASCKNVPDEALATLPDFPALTQFMPMDVPDAGFRHVGQCSRLEAVWCMYCRDTGDIATEHLSALPGLRTYYAGQTLITDRSLELLSRMSTLERLTFWNCAGVTDAGVGHLGRLPRLRELSLSQMPRLTRQALTQIPPTVHVEFTR